MSIARHDSSKARMKHGKLVETRWKDGKADLFQIPEGRERSL